MARHSAAFKRPPAPVPSAGRRRAAWRGRDGRRRSISPARWSRRRGRYRAPARPRRPVERVRPLRAGGAGERSTTAGRISKTCRCSRPPSRSMPPARSSPATTRPTSRSTARSIRIAVASTAASTASPGRPTPISDCRRGSISRSKLFVKPEAAKLLERERRAPGYVPRTIAIGTNTDPYQPIEREVSGDAPHPRSAGALRPSGRHRHQVGAGDARHRHPVPDGGAGSPRSRCR